MMVLSFFSFRRKFLVEFFRVDQDYPVGYVDQDRQAQKMQNFFPVHNHLILSV